jgi:hypothetical protein
MVVPTTQDKSISHVEALSVDGMSQAIQYHTDFNKHKKYNMVTDSLIVLDRVEREDCV